jgi:hypothetical protein
VERQDQQKVGNLEAQNTQDQLVQSLELVEQLSSWLVDLHRGKEVEKEALWAIVD